MFTGGISSMEDSSSQTDFDHAVATARTLPAPDNATKLKLYGWYKFVVDGPCLSPRPALWNFEASAKWKAWSSVNGDRSSAMKSYIELVNNLQETQSTATNAPSPSFSVSVSKMKNSNKEEACVPDDIFDVIALRRADIAMKLITESPEDCFKRRSDDKLTVLHLAVDRELTEVVELILSYGSGRQLLSVHDVYGEVPMDYARTVDNDEIVNILKTHIN